MPIYEYRCDDCSEVFEAIQRVADEPLDSCRRCGGPAKRIVSSPAIHFVGTGWYVTDYARKNQNGKGDGETGEGKKAESGAPGSSRKEGGTDSSSPAARQKGGEKAAETGKDRGSARAAGGSGGPGADSSGRPPRGENRAGAAS